MKKTFIMIVLLYLNGICIQAQDYSLSQSFESPLMLNPANSGLNYKVRTNLNYRQQWRSISKPFTTAVASADGILFSQGSSGSSLGAGILIINDQAGSSKMNTLNINLAFSGKVMIDDMQSISAGLSGGIMQRSFDYNNLTWTDQFDGYSYNPAYGNSENFSDEKQLSPDISTGIQWSYGKGSATLSSNNAIGAQIGLAAMHVNKPIVGFNEEVDKRYIKYIFHSCFSYKIKNTDFQLNPIFLYQFQGPSQMYYAGTYVKYHLHESSKYTGYLFNRSLNFGFFYRAADAFIIAAQLEWDQFAFGLSYDINVSQLTKVSYGRGGIEASLRYLPFKPKAVNRLL